MLKDKIEKICREFLGLIFVGVVGLFSLLPMRANAQPGLHYFTFYSPYDSKTNPFSQSNKEKQVFLKILITSSTEERKL